MHSKPHIEEIIIKEAFIYLFTSVISFFITSFDKSEDITADYPVDIPNAILRMASVQLNAA